MRSVVNGPVRGTSGDLDMRSSMALFPCGTGNFSSSVSEADFLFGELQVSGCVERSHGNAKLQLSFMFWQKDSTFLIVRLASFVHCLKPRK